MTGNFSAWNTSVGGTSVLSATVLTCTLSVFSSTGQAPEELFGKPVHQIYHPEWGPLLKNASSYYKSIQIKYFYVWGKYLESIHEWLETVNSILPVSNIKDPSLSNCSFYMQKSLSFK